MYSFHLVVVTLALGALALSKPTLAEDESKKTSAEATFKTATDLMEKRQFKQAIPYLRLVQKDFPENPAVLWNLGIAMVETGDHKKAAETWRSLRKVDPDDWRARSKLVQAYQALDDLKARDQEIKGLYNFHQNSADPKVKALERFCREQTVMAGRSVFAFEYYSPQRPWKKYFVFSVLDKEGYEESQISLGSYDLTTEISRELGEISNDQRTYHLDGYKGDFHKTYAFFEEKPDYDRIRSMVVEILNGKPNPISASKAGDRK